MDFVRIVEIVVFLGLVIFVHELGHYLAARWCGVLVERFSIGFGPVLLSFKRGDTEYAISLIPLGGYVKMLGQSDTPGIEEESNDSRSYQNKSVPQRMVIISAGVVMNIIFGLICFAIAYGVGVPESPAVVGTALPGKPAWKAGLQPGDKIVEINGEKNPNYKTFLQRVVLSPPGEGSVQLTVDRAGEELDFAITPERLNRPIIGVMQSDGLQVVDHPRALPARRSSAAAEASDPGFERGDRILSVDGTAVENYQQYRAELYKHRQDTVTIQVERATDGSKSPTTADISVAPTHMRALGLVMTLGDITGIRGGSAAERAVDASGASKPLEEGDRIVAVNGDVNFNPMRLADIIGDRAGEEVELTIRRKARTPEEFTVVVVPEARPSWSDFPSQPFPSSMDMSIPSLGIAYNVASVVYAVEPESPAAASGKIQPNDVVEKITYFIPKRDDPKTETTEEGFDEVGFKCGEGGWPGAFWALQNSEVAKVLLSIQRPTEEGSKESVQVELTPVEDPTWFLAVRGVNLDWERNIRQAESIVEALSLGIDFTLNTMADVYMTLRGLLAQDLAPDLLSGPLRLGYTAYVVSEDFMTLILLIGLININLAVVNFLPIPVLDGGHMVFLLYEAIFRRKPNEKFLLAMNYVGVAFILSLMIFVLYLDVKNLFFSDT